MKYLTGILTLLFFSMHISAQKIDRAEIQKMQIEFLKERLQLTNEESEKFIPLYQEFDEKREALHDKRRQMMHQFKQNSLNMSNKELTAMADEIIAQEQKSALLSAEYHEKFKAVLPPVKVIILYKSEHEFKKHLINKMRHRGGRSSTER